MRTIITGASSGIGRELATVMSAASCELILNARRHENLAQLEQQLGQGVSSIAGDITEPSVREQLIEHASSRWGALDVLVNNAGVGALGRFDTSSSDTLRRVLEVNFFAAVELIRLALPLLRTGSRPTIVNISSILGHRGVPRSSEYCASKFALQGFSEALRAELARDGMHVLVVSPGTTDTEFFEHVVERSGNTRWAQQRGVRAEHVAIATWRAIERQRHEIVPNVRGQLLVWLNRLCPWGVDKLLERYG